MGWFSAANRKGFKKCFSTVIGAKSTMLGIKSMPILQNKTRNKPVQIGVGLRPVLIGVDSKHHERNIDR